MNKRIITKLLALSLACTIISSGCARSKASQTTRNSGSEGVASSATSEVVQTSETTVEPTKETTMESSTEMTTQPTTESTTELTTESATEMTTEPTTESTTEPSTETTTEATTETTTESTTETTSEPTTEATRGTTAPVDPNGEVMQKLRALRGNILGNAAYYDSLDNDMKESWCFKRMTDHSPSGSYEYFTIADYNGVYRNKEVAEDDKVIYLTFDCGYPSDKTVSLLDTLAKHNAKASFFVTKMYLEKCSDYAIRMKQEGHMVCNHTVTHSDLVPKSVEEIAGEIFDVAEFFYEKTGYELDPYFRTPKGTYTKRLMTIINDAGYKTVFWSIAYVDYNPEAQPEPGYVTEHFATYHHNGAIALMHNDSQANVDELDAVLTLLENEGYRFGLLDELDE